MTVCVLSVYDSMGHSVYDHIHRSPLTVYFIASDLKKLDFSK